MTRRRPSACRVLVAEIRSPLGNLEIYLDRFQRLAIPIIFARIAPYRTCHAKDEDHLAFPMAALRYPATGTGDPDGLFNPQTTAASAARTWQALARRRASSGARPPAQDARPGKHQRARRRHAAGYRSSGRAGRPKAGR